jgi:hypothetical protein
LGLTLEYKLLINCARTRLSDKTIDEIRDILSHKIDWDELKGSAYSSDLAQMLYHNLKRFSVGQLVPESFIEELKTVHHRTIATGMHFYNELKRILQAFEASGISVIALKGVVLAEVVYRNIALRPFSDFDLLVKKEDLSKVEDLMSNLGYTSMEGERSREWYRNNHHHLCPFVNSEKSTIVEIHMHVTSQPVHLEVEAIWLRAKKVRIADCEILMLSAEDMIIHLILHLFNHGFDRSILTCMCDINETIGYYRDSIDWTLLRNEVVKSGISKLVCTVLYLVKRYYGNEGYFPVWLDPEVVSIDTGLVDIMERKIFNNDDWSEPPGPLVQSLAVDSVWAKSSILLKMIFPSREVMSKRYAIPTYSWKLYFHYLTRPYSLLLKYGKHIVGSSANGKN